MQVLQNLTANGQGTLNQSFSGAFASGGAGVALRGLTVGATLVLIDGHRMAPYPIGDDGQRSFVDISGIPFDTIERVEVLKDGASAVYGSDAVAGVVNIILKKTFVGLTATADGGTSSHADGSTVHTSVTFGMGDLEADGHNFYVSAEYRHQEQIRFSDRGGLFTQTDFTGTGGEDVTFGRPNLFNGSTPISATGYVTDPAGAVAGFFPGCNATQFNAGTCTYTNTWSQIQPETSNINFVGKFTQKLAADWTLGVQGTYFESRAQQVTAASTTFTGGYTGVTSGPGVIPSFLAPLGPTTIPATNPSFPAGTGLAGGNLVYSFQQPLGPIDTETDSKAMRAVIDLDGKIGTWDVNFSAGYTEVRLGISINGIVLAGALQDALNSPTDPYLVGGNNTASVLNSIAPAEGTTDTSKLSFVHLGTNGEIFTMPGGPFSVGFGTEYYYRKQDALAPEQIASGLSASASNNFTVGSQEVASAYTEFSAPIVKQFEIDGAVRYDHYNLSGGKASPKIGFKFTPIPEFAIRGTAAHGFRAPGPAENGSSGQTFFAGAFTDPILCPHPDNITAAGNFKGQCNAPVASVQSTNPNLKAETSKSYTLGFIFEPLRDISATLDLYQIQIDNQIVSGGPQTLVRSNNLSPLPEYNADGTTSLVVPPSPPIAYFGVSYINANTTKTDGWDLGLSYHHRFDNGFGVRSEGTWSYIRKYLLSVGGETFELAGTHGPFVISGDTGNPKSRVSWANTVAYGPVSVTGTLNYISSFKNTDPSAAAFEGPASEQSTCLGAINNGFGVANGVYGNQTFGGVIPPQVGCEVKHFTTFDLYGKYDATDKLSVHGSVTNLFNAKAPVDWVTYAGGGAPWDPSLHLQGAIGTFFNVGVTYKFW
jgi:iron complex outermembrane receptor protein